MKKPARQQTPEVEAELVRLPVFANSDPVGRMAAMAVSGSREMQVSVRGERVVEHEVVRMPPLEDIARDVPLPQLVEVLKIKMYNEAIADQTVYDLLFEDRLEQQWAREYRAQTKPFWKKGGK